VIGATVPLQGPGLHQGAHTLLQKEGIALRAGNQELREGHQTRVISQEGLEQLLGARRGQWVEPELRVIRFAPPAMLILGAVIDQ
jgi:hypothetical protein